MHRRLVPVALALLLAAALPAGTLPRKAPEFTIHLTNGRQVARQLVLVDRGGNIRAQYAGDDPFLNEDRQETNIRQKTDQLLTESNR